MPIDHPSTNPETNAPDVPQTINDRPDFVTVGSLGLGINTFATKPPRGETAIIRKRNHTLSVKVFKLKPGGQMEKVKDFGGAADDATALPDDTEISIRATLNPKIMGYAKYTLAQLEFVRLALSAALDAGILPANYIFDLRWLMDLEGCEVHNSKLQPVKKKKFTKLFIHNAEFYCRSLLPLENSAKPARQGRQVGQVTHTPDGKIVDYSGSSQVNIGYVGHELGAKIEADEVVISVNGDSYELRKANLETGERYFIQIINQCPTPSNVSDFPVLYDLLQVGQAGVVEVKIDLLSSGAKEEFAPTVKFCGSVHASKQDGISDLLPSIVE